MFLIHKLTDNEKIKTRKAPTNIIVYKNLLLIFSTCKKRQERRVGWRIVCGGVGGHFSMRKEGIVVPWRSI